MSDVERQTLDLLERHGVRVADAQANFGAEHTLVAPASQLAGVPFTLSNQAMQSPADSSSNSFARAAPGHGAAETCDDEEPNERLQRVLPTNVTRLELLRIKTIRPSQDCVEVLFSQDGLTIGQSFSLAGKLQFGRGKRCDVQIESHDVSRNHCVVERTQRGIVLVDTNSTNGVLVNGARVGEQVILKHGDKFQINRSVFALLTPLETVRVFVCYGGPDHDFASRFSAALGLEGFDVFFFPENAPDHAGNPIHLVTRSEISQRDYVLAIFSAAALTRPGFRAELGHALEKEEEFGRCGGLLIPIALDESYRYWEPGSVVSDAIRRRVVLHFEASLDAESFSNAVARLAATLRKRGRQS